MHALFRLSPSRNRYELLRNRDAGVITATPHWHCFIDTERRQTLAGAMR